MSLVGQRRLSPERLRVRVPATSANLGPGFDCMGLALELFNEMELQLADAFSVEIHGASAHLLPTTRDNLVVQAIETVLEYGRATDLSSFRLVLNNDIPIASGLGSSASAIVGGLLLGNALLEHHRPQSVLSLDAVLDMAIELEGHPDNVTPALLGGAWLSVPDDTRTRAYPMPVPDSLIFVAAVPNFFLHTEDARSVVPKTVPLSDAVTNSAQAARLALALSTGNLSYLHGGFRDTLHEPYRKALIPGMDEVRQAAMRAGALLTTLSGAGPSILAWCESEHRAQRVADEITLAWREFNIECFTHLSRTCRIETRVVSAVENSKEKGENSVEVKGL